MLTVCQLCVCLVEKLHVSKQTMCIVYLTDLTISCDVSANLKYLVFPQDLVSVEFLRT